MRDSFVHKGKRRILIDYLREKIGIKDMRVLEAMQKIPRHLFLDSIFSDLAYEDRAFPIPAGQTISHPSTVAEQTELLEVKPGDTVLEIGTGCGYQAAVLMEMGAQVFTIERQRELYEFSQKKFRELRITPKAQLYSDGFLGLPEKAPFDKILVTCGAPELPPELLKQLKVGGRLVIPVGKGDEQMLYRFTRVADKEFEKEQFGIYKFVPMLEDTK